MGEKWEVSGDVSGRMGVEGGGGGTREKYIRNLYEQKHKVLKD